MSNDKAPAPHRARGVGDGILPSLPPGFGLVQPDAGGLIPPPPYQLRDCTFLMIGAEFDRATAQSVLPPGLEATDEGTGGFYMYTAPEGWGLAPYTATIGFVDVKGYDSADGSRARALVVANYSGRAGESFSIWNTYQRMGYAELHPGPEICRGIGGPDGEVHLRAEIRRLPGTATPAAGTHYYVLKDPAGGLSLCPVAYCFDFGPAEPVALENLAPAGSILSSLRKCRLTWAGWLTDAVITIGAPVRIDDPEASTDAAATVHLNLLSQLGRGAVVIGPAGLVLFRNSAAEEMAAGAYSLDHSMFGPADTAAERRLSDAITAKISGNWEGFATDPIPLPRAGRSPLFVQPIQLSARHTRSAGPQAQPGEGSVLLLITDPDRGTEKDPARALELLGLAPAEARIAALVGAGLPPKEVARRLDNTEGTVRFTLNQVYRKLGVGRQSELARIVARLESLGV